MDNNSTESMMPEQREILSAEERKQKFTQLAEEKVSDKEVKLSSKMQEPRWKKAARIALGTVMSLFAAGSIPAGVNSVQQFEEQKSAEPELQAKTLYQGPMDKKNTSWGKPSNIVVIDSKGREMSGSHGSGTKDTSDSVQIEVPEEVTHNLNSYQTTGPVKQ